MLWHLIKGKKDRNYVGFCLLCVCVCPPYSGMPESICSMSSIVTPRQRQEIKTPSPAQTWNPPKMLQTILPKANLERKDPSCHLLLVEASLGCERCAPGDGESCAEIAPLGLLLNVPE